ncbi:MAG: hypothetical protein HOD97_03210 [Candidatus Marinimicrobia bacterium]|jgi:hypothetical protein|nr:hypothetical protein [Candidatus Neomarinimicrobiota bacterium]MBT3618291.1 hypothetical protein [Candidatus Neomarinimicrobiota bacterium]MBT3828236.1 hypothetical protein [Candidatus Neomarinimicrobiota bacterium]MBT3997153.1 hypothetical protein [Candidatus Neomarinimicrobiota bacterium]MBT4280619.1 hypothetical protein [Candidatus Neomarinimicrobiota bacterium]
MKKLFQNSGLILAMIFMVIMGDACRNNYDATAQDMSEYGWTLYEQEDFSNSALWFQNSIQNDTIYKDGYNGIAWSFGQLTYIDSSIKYFNKGILLSDDPFNVIDVANELKAGLCFAYNARGNVGDDSMAIIWGDTVIGATVGFNKTPWTFTHDTTMNYLDVMLTLGMSNFGVGNFSQSLDHVSEIWAVLNPSISVANIDILTVDGRRELAVQLDSLQTYLATP